MLSIKIKCPPKAQHACHMYGSCQTVVCGCMSPRVHTVRDISYILLCTYITYVLVCTYISYILLCTYTSYVLLCTYFS